MFHMDGNDSYVCSVFTITIGQYGQYDYPQYWLMMLYNMDSHGM